MKKIETGRICWKLGDKCGPPPLPPRPRVGQGVGPNELNEWDNAMADLRRVAEADPPVPEAAGQGVAPGP